MHFSLCVCVYSERKFINSMSSLFNFKILQLRIWDTQFTFRLIKSIHSCQNVNHIANCTFVVRYVLTLMTTIIITSAVIFDKTNQISLLRQERHLGETLYVLSDKEIMQVLKCQRRKSQSPTCYIYIISLKDY